MTFRQGYDLHCHSRALRYRTEPKTPRLHPISASVSVDVITVLLKITSYKEKAAYPSSIIVNVTVYTNNARR